MGTEPSAELSELERERIIRTLEALPADARTGLEIGFHDFRLTRVLRQRINLVSTDLIAESPAPQDYRLVRAKLPNLPWCDASFDIVICTEVLEHLDEGVLPKAVEELQRVARKYVLISVPYKQRVWNEMSRCLHCDGIVNSMGHLRYLDGPTLASLFRGAAVLRKDLIGKVSGYAPDSLYWVASHLGGAWMPRVYPHRCPLCGGEPMESRPNPLGWVLQRLIWRWERRASSRPAWILMLFEA